MRTIWIAFFIFIIAAPIAIGQPVRGLPPGKMIKIAEEKYQAGDIYNALEWYEKVYEEDQKNTHVIERLATIQYTLRDFKNAEKWYKRLVRRDRDVEYKDAGLIYGQILKMNGKYPEAIAQFESFIETSSDSRLQTWAENEIVGAQLAMGMAEPEGLKVENVGSDINSPFTEFSPIVNNDVLYYAAIRSDSVIVLESSGQDVFAKIYTSNKIPGGTWEQGKPLNKNINDGTAHSGQPTFSPDGSEMIYTRCILEGNLLKKCDLYSSNKQGDGWSKATQVKGLGGDYTTKQPSFGEVNGKSALFYSSDMSGGYGGFDIYYSMRNKNGSYDAPINMGSKLNSIANEETPYFNNADKTLYYSSNGLPGIGGYDVFASKWNGSDWSAPENQGIGVNSKVDDLYYSLDESGYNGFIVSNRPGTTSLKSETCCDDIFSLFYPDKIPFKLNTLSYEKESKNDLSGITVRLIEKETGIDVDSKTNKIANTVDFDLVRNKSYLIISSREGYYSDSTEVSTLNLLEAKTFDSKLYLKKIPPPPPPPPPVKIEPKYTFILPRLDTIYYDFDKHNIRPDAAAKLDDLASVMAQYPQLVIEVASHTDALGTNEYNDILASERTQESIAYLIAKGVPRLRLIARSYGEYKPIAANRLDTGADNPIGRQLNRRTEFRITEGVDENGQIRIQLSPGSGYIQPTPINDVIVSTAVATTQVNEEEGIKKKNSLK